MHEPSKKRTTALFTTLAIAALVILAFFLGVLYSTVQSQFADRFMEEETELVADGEGAEEVDEEEEGEGVDVADKEEDTDDASTDDVDVPAEGDDESEGSSALASTELRAMVMASEDICTPVFSILDRDELSMDYLVGRGAGLAAGALRDPEVQNQITPTDITAFAERDAYFAALIDLAVAEGIGLYSTCETEAAVYAAFFGPAFGDVHFLRWDLSAGADQTPVLYEGIPTMDAYYQLYTLEAFDAPLIFTGYGDAGTVSWRYHLLTDAGDVELLEDCRGRYEGDFTDETGSFAYTCELEYTF